MAKICPVCRRTYSDRATYCDEDGVNPVGIARALDNPPAEPATVAPDRAAPVAGGVCRRYAVLLCVAATLAVLGACGGRYACKRYLQNGIEVMLTDISLPSGAKVSELENNPGILERVTSGVIGAARAITGGGDLITHVAVKNRTSCSGNLVSARYAVISGGAEIGRGEWQPEGGPLEFQSGRDLALDLPLRLNAENTMASAVNALIGKSAAIKVSGDVTVKLWFGDITVPFTVQRLGIKVIGK